MDEGRRGRLLSLRESRDTPGLSRNSRVFQACADRPWAYWAAERVVDCMALRGLKPYQVSAIRCIMYDFRDGFVSSRGVPCIYTSAFIPTELVYGLGAVPFLPEVAAGYAAAFGFGDDSLAASEALWYSADLCSFHRAGVGAYAIGLTPRPSAVIVSSHLCDGGKKSLYQMAQSVGCPFHILDVPYVASDRGERWLARQAEEIADDLSSKVKGLSAGRMSDAIRASNEAMSRYREVCETRRHSPVPWRGAEALNYVALFMWAWGNPRLGQFYADLAQHVASVVTRGEYPIADERHRLLWLNLRPYYKTSLLDYLEKECGASIAFEEYSWPYWSCMDESDPYGSIARKMVSHFGWGPIERRLAAVDRIIDNYSIDGVVQFAQWGCRQSNGGASILKAHLAERGIPFLNLSGDGVDVRNSGEAQAVTRLGAFVELLDSRTA